jgi:hypothetical protein
MCADHLMIFRLLAAVRPSGLGADRAVEFGGPAGQIAVMHIWSMRRSGSASGGFCMR